MNWHLDEAFEVGVRRRGFTVASDFSGTARSYAGDTLKAALADLLAWDTKPDKPAQLSGYMCASRVKSIDDLIIVQPYSPTLFAQGDLPGPERLLKFQRGELDDVEEAWNEKRTKKETKAVRWPADLLLYCRRCSEDCGREVYKRLRDFPGAKSEHLWNEVIALG